MSFLKTVNDTFCWFYSFALLQSAPFLFECVSKIQRILFLLRRRTFVAQDVLLDFVFVLKVGNSFLEEKVNRLLDFLFVLGCI